jgi:ribosome-associated toxin RatA of RatAB toxin-antitoxin module
MIVKKSVIVTHPPEKIFRLVADIENYPKYLPWCTQAVIREQTEHEVVGAVYIEYLKVKTYFVTRNINFPYSKIDMQLVEGPFKELAGSWNFLPLGEHGCKVEFSLEYKFSNYFVEKIIGPVFNYISKNIVECFIQQANKQYGKSTD